MITVDALCVCCVSSSNLLSIESPVIPYHFGEIQHCRRLAVRAHWLAVPSVTLIVLVAPDGSV
jgi:hypothetical protein